MIDRNKILSPWQEYTSKTIEKQRGSLIYNIITKHLNQEGALHFHGFKRTLINGDPLPSWHVFEENNRWITNIENRFDKVYTIANDARKYVDDVLIKEGYYLIDDWGKFEKLKVLL